MRQVFQDLTNLVALWLTASFRSVFCVLEGLKQWSRKCWVEKGCGHGAPVHAAAVATSCLLTGPLLVSAHLIIPPQVQYLAFGVVESRKAPVSSLLQPMSPWTAALLPSVLLAPTILEWAANLMTVSSTTSSGLLLKMLTGTGPRTDPCSALLVTSLWAEHHPLSPTSQSFLYPQ